MAFQESSLACRGNDQCMYKDVLGVSFKTQNGETISHGKIK